LNYAFAAERQAHESKNITWDFSVPKLNKTSAKMAQGGNLMLKKTLRWLLTLIYKVEIKGLDNYKKSRKTCPDYIQSHVLSGSVIAGCVFTR